MPNTSHLSPEASARLEELRQRPPSRHMRADLDDDAIVAFLIPPEFCSVFNLLPVISEAPSKIPVHIVPGLSVMVYLKKNGDTYPLYPPTQGQPN